MASISYRSGFEGVTVSARAADGGKFIPVISVTTNYGSQVDDLGESFATEKKALEVGMETARRWYPCVPNTPSG